MQILTNKKLEELKDGIEKKYINRIKDLENDINQIRFKELEEREMMKGEYLQLLSYNQEEIERLKLFEVEVEMLKKENKTLKSKLTKKNNECEKLIEMTNKR